MIVYYVYFATLLKWYYVFEPSHCSQRQYQLTIAVYNKGVQLVKYGQTKGTVHTDRRCHVFRRSNCRNWLK